MRERGTLAERTTTEIREFRPPFRRFAALIVAGLGLFFLSNGLVWGHQISWSGIVIGVLLLGCSLASWRRALLVDADGVRVVRPFRPRALDVAWNDIAKFELVESPRHEPVALVRASDQRVICLPTFPKYRGFYDDPKHKDQRAKAQAQVDELNRLLGEHSTPPATPGPALGGQRRLRPYAQPFAIWTVFLVLPIVVALGSGSLLWLVLAIPSLSWMVLLGGRLLPGRLYRDWDETLRFDQILIDVGGVDAFGVSVQTGTDMPVVLHRRGPRPAVYAGISFVKPASDQTLRGVAALMHAALADADLNKRVDDMEIARVIVVLVVAALAGLLAPSQLAVLAAVSSVGFSGWLTNAAAIVWSRFRERAGRYAASDLEAARLVGDQLIVADALVAMSEWLETHRRQRSILARVAHRIINPVRPMPYQTERALVLRKSATPDAMR